MISYTNNLSHLFIFIKFPSTYLRSKMIPLSFIIIITSLLATSLSLPLNASGSNLNIAGGEPADIKDFPYQVSLRLGNAKCGGAILNEKYILSAAHCTYDVDPKEIMVRAGSNLLNSGGVVIAVDATFQHESFDPVTYDYDIVILKLKEDLTFTDSISPIDLVPAGFIIEDNRLAIVTGYGAIGPDGPLAKSLQKVDLPLISTETCQTIYGSEYITERMFCAGYAVGGKDACPGDSGGAIVLDGKVIGLVSFGPACAAPNSPGGYTKVSEFRSFIDSIIGNV
ncbi:trypsin-3-like [Coccinella septempunctata]|uniref:trypsin-3-like n=1 Tax=Coccinella septempunctata TaxID=41139 RepID=UPI001D095F8A|nr:trypsin-3-like [Coccinella septempunctata]